MRWLQVKEWLLRKQRVAVRVVEAVAMADLSSEYDLRLCTMEVNSLLRSWKFAVLDEADRLIPRRAIRSRRAISPGSFVD
jgi:hypothetical protein